MNVPWYVLTVWCRWWICVGDYVKNLKIIIPWLNSASKRLKTVPRCRLVLALLYVSHSFRQYSLVTFCYTAVYNVNCDRLKTAEIMKLILAIITSPECQWDAEYCHFFMTFAVFRLTPPSRPNKVGLRCPFVRLFIRLSVHPSTKRFFNFNEIWHVVEVDEWCMTVCSMTRSKVKVKVMSAWKSEIWPFSTATSPIYNGGCQMTTDF